MPPQRRRAARVLRGEDRGAHRDALVLEHRAGAGAGGQVVPRAPRAVARAERAIDDGRASALLDALAPVRREGRR
jgi:anthranilate phosphoribosyltransferase